jgi:hypothetical protein
MEDDNDNDNDNIFFLFVQVTEVKQLGDDQPEKYSSEVTFFVEKYEIV